jgi:hypothetical protein
VDTNTAIVWILGLVILGLVGVAWAIAYNNSFEEDKEDDK